MRFFVRHESLYRYSVPVELALHTLRLNPRLHDVSLASHVLTISPEPASRVERIDPFGNRVTELGFRGATQQLRIESRFELDTYEPPPPAPPQLPLIGDSAALYRDAGSIAPAVAAFAFELAQQVGPDSLAFLDRLAATLAARTDKQPRLAGMARPAAVTLATQQGACRDLTELFVAACRVQGFASRPVSGYVAPLDDLDQPRELHVWAEVLTQNGVWRGWDPTSGQRVTAGHVALCAAPSQSATLPVEGGYSFQGAALTTTLDFDLRISIEPRRQTGISL